MKLVAIHTVHVRDEKEKLIVAKPGDIFSVDAEEGERLIALGAAAAPAKAAATVDHTEEGAEAEAPKAKGKKGKAADADDEVL